MLGTRTARLSWGNEAVVRLARSIALPWAVLWLFAARGGAQEAVAARRPDVLLILADDLGKRVGYLGDPVARTPNLDALAARGMRFERAYCQAPLCNPSRVSLLTGLGPATTGVLDNTTDWRNNPRIRHTLPQVFAASGYETVSAGKVFHLSKSDESRWTRTLKPIKVRREGVNREGTSTTTRLGLLPRGHAPLLWGTEGEELLDQIDGRVAETVAQFLVARAADAPPLFLAVGLNKPHSPFLAPRSFLERIDAARIALPESPADDWEDIPSAALEGAATGVNLDPKVWREILHAYYGCSAYLDACVGRILDALRTSGRSENTIVVFTGDHGLLLGEHRLWLKELLFEEAVACPLLVVTPDGRGAGRSSPALVELMDVMPTLAELCGVPLPEEVDGLSFVPLLTAPERPWKKAAFSHTARGTSVRTADWRLNVWASGAAELYDHRTDPREFVNLAGNPAAAEAEAELRALLKEGWRGARPPP